LTSECIIPLSLKKMEITFILVQPAVPENVGAAARAIKTMGFSKMLLVDTEAHKDEKALWLAHGSHEILHQAQYANSLKDVSKDFDLLIGTSAKKRSVKQDYIPIKNLLSFITAAASHIKTVAVVFGSEESGLSNEDLNLCHVVSNIPLATTFPSLNLAQAIMLYAWELSDLKAITTHSDTFDEPHSLPILRERMKNLLLWSGFHHDSPFIGRVLERIAFLSPKDANMLHSACNKILNKIKS